MCRVGRGRTYFSVMVKDGGVQCEISSTYFFVIVKDGGVQCGISSTSSFIDENFMHNSFTVANYSKQECDICSCLVSEMNVAFI